MNIGRVLTPTLNLIVERENEINNFVPKTTYGSVGTFTIPGGDTYTGKLQIEDPFTKKEDAEDFIRKLSDKGTIVNVEKTTKKTNPPYLYNTSILQQEANSIYGFTLDKTLKIAQSLYEGGYTTYPRVDSQYLTEDKKAEIPGLLTKLLTLNRYKGMLLLPPLPCLIDTLMIPRWTDMMLLSLPASCLPNSQMIKLRFMT